MIIKIDSLKSYAFGYFIKLISSKYLTPASTMLGATVLFIAYGMLQPFEEIEQISNLLPLIHGLVLLFGFMGFAQFVQAIFPYGHFEGFDKIFNGMCILCTVCSLLYVVEGILGIGSTKSFFIISSIICMAFGTLYFMWRKILKRDKHQEGELNDE